LLLLPQKGGRRRIGGERAGNGPQVSNLLSPTTIAKMQSWLLVLWSSLLIMAAAKPSLSPYVLHEKRHHVPDGWRHDRKHHHAAVLPLRFALTQPNIDNMGQYLEDVSDPDSPNYGNHWSMEKVAEVFAPSPETIAIVRSWLNNHGFAYERIRLSPTRLWLELNATVEEAEDLLRTEYNVYKHETGTEHVACNEYHLPQHISPHVDFVLPTIHFNAILSKRDGAGDPKVGQPGFGSGPKTLGPIQQTDINVGNCDQFITPDCLRGLYKIKFQPMAPQLNSFGIVEYTPQAYLQSDLQKFSQQYAPDLNGKSPVLVSIDGGVVQTQNQGFQYNGESNLDLQYGMALVTGAQPVTLYQVGDTVEGASFNTFLDALDGSYCTFDGGDDPSVDPHYPDNNPGGYNGPAACGTVTPAKVISTSYGYNEADLSRAYTQRQCTEYGKLGLLGVSFIYSSGDNGVAGNGGRCLNPDGSQSTNGNIFNPTFPSGCPWVTSVGATQINPGKTVSDPESACQQVIFSGGGFSNHFEIPAYQQKAVGSYLTNHHPSYPPTIWNATGHARAYPDVSANGANYVVAVDGQFFLVYGTSASAPVFAAILTMINDARLSKGKPAVGFINPIIYSGKLTGGFNDIVSGNNPGCGTNGFTAVQGWDPVTGLGTPNLPALLSKWINL
jgi:tripeptidyl-peptidase-1